MEDGIGRLLTSDDRERWQNLSLRCAFVIGAGYVVTAWRCISDIGGTSARVWLRLQSKTERRGFIDIPLIYQNHAEDLDIALLVLDSRPEPAAEQQLAPGQLRSLMDAVALPLGTAVEAYDQVRVGGFPGTDLSSFCEIWSGKVGSMNAMVRGRRAMRLHIDGLAARFRGNPHGMSGGPVLGRCHDGSERVVGVLCDFPTSAPGEGGVGGETLARHVADLRDVFPAVNDALRRAHAQAESGSSRSGSGRSGSGRPLHESAVTAPVELSPDVQDRYRTTLNSVHSVPPARWTADNLSRLRREVESRSGGRSKIGDTLAALCAGVHAKQVFVDIDGPKLELGHLQVIYRREIGDWPAGYSADALLVEAADVELIEPPAVTLGALARFMTGVAARLGVEPQGCPQFSDWITSRGHQVGDAQQHYRQRKESPAWLLIDFGDEPRDLTAIWPTTVTWTRCAGDGTITGAVTCEGTEEDVRRALREILRIVPPARPLLVDFSVPYSLMNKGIEQWRVVHLDDDFVELPAESRPRLRWSRRRRDLVLHNRLLDRAVNASWEAGAAELSDEILSDYQKLIKWIREHPQRACLVGGSSGTPESDPLRTILREGYGFVIWLSSGFKAAHRSAVCQAVQDVPSPARRRILPDELWPHFDDQRPAIIWDDPFGREGFDLPPLVLPECL